MSAVASVPARHAQEMSAVASVPARHAREMSAVASVPARHAQEMSAVARLPARRRSRDERLMAEFQLSLCGLRAFLKCESLWGL